ncbi:MAG TPA: hypothetical protein VMW03_03070 [Candidatus Krumholzibacteriaceae bacterium]|nr:hypothetical protein [Candidatus Krumholzibacteriaceae bacterium]
MGSSNTDTLFPPNTAEVPPSGEFVEKQAAEQGLIPIVPYEADA